MNRSKSIRSFIKFTHHQCHHHTVKLQDYHIIGLQNNMQLLAKEIRSMEKHMIDLSLKIDKLEKGLQIEGKISQNSINKIKIL